MASIAHLLNPVEDPQQFRQLPSPSSTEASPPRPKKQKVSKDAPIFVKGKPRGVVRYPPYEYQDEELRKAHERFRLHPMGRIEEFPRHIPYNSDKKPFMGETGRGGFEVFQYTFTMPDTGKIYTVMWDYNIGLVRTTAFFKCNGYGKTTPAKMLNANKGLKPICHSITGGALAAQGYWVPYEAAKAVASTFCWDIRHVLTPVFGIDFLSMCRPRNAKNFGMMDVSQEIIQRATETAREYRRLETPHPKPATTSSPRTPGDSREYHDGNEAHPVQSQQAERVTGSEGGGENCTSPIPRWSRWTPANMPQSDKSSPVPLPSIRELFWEPPPPTVEESRLPPALLGPAFVPKAHKKLLVTADGLWNGVHGMEGRILPYVENRKEQPGPSSSERKEIEGNGGWRDEAEGDRENGDDDDDSYESDSPSEGSSLGSENEWERYHLRILENETNAAHALMNLSNVDDDDAADRKRRRAST